MPGAENKLPSYEEIEKRAYELYLQDGERFSATEYWLRAEEELKNENAAPGTASAKKKTVVAGAGGIAKTDE